MRTAVNLITTFVTVFILAQGWAILCDNNTLGDGVSTLGGFLIGFFGARLIYNWLNKPDTPSNTSVEPE